MEVINTVTICKVFPVAIEYGSQDELLDDEIKMLENWLEHYKNCYFTYSETVCFAKCDITMLYSDCVEVTIYGL